MSTEECEKKLQTRFKVACGIAFILFVILVIVLYMFYNHHADLMLIKKYHDDKWKLNKIVISHIGRSEIGFTKDNPIPAQDV